MTGQAAVSEAALTGEIACLVGDVGGTNTRLAVWDGARLQRQTRISNDAHTSFPDLLRCYLEAQPGLTLTTCCIAIAGPVTGGRAELTNRSWVVEPAEIADVFRMTSSRDVYLANDLVAQGHALSVLRGDQLTDLRGASGAGGQQLVVGMGTGFNVCLVRDTATGPVVFEAELGHASLPDRVARVLRDVLGDKAGAISTNEDIFSGRGLSRLYGLLTGWGDRPGEAILADYDPSRQSAETRTVDLAARLMGLMARELVYYYLPMGGIYFAGSVARGILSTSARSIFLDSFTRPGRFVEQVEQVPVRIISDDGAALLGAARIASVQRPTA